MSNPLLECKAILEEIMKKKDAEPFLKPVPWKEWNLLDYPTIVKEPMDLGTVRSKLGSNEYDDVFQYAHDMRLVFSNCMTYNPETTEVHALGKKLKNDFERRFKHLCENLPEEWKLPSVETKKHFADNLYQLTREEITHIATILLQKCNRSVDQTTEGFIDIKVDSIAAPVFHELYAYQMQCLSH